MKYLTSETVHNNNENATCAYCGKILFSCSMHGTCRKMHIAFPVQCMARVVKSKSLLLFNALHVWWNPHCFSFSMRGTCREIHVGSPVQCMPRVVKSTLLLLFNAWHVSWNLWLLNDLILTKMINILKKDGKKYN